MNNNQEWLDGLQIGDEVAMNVGSFGYSSFIIETVTKITPTRRISTSNGKTFSSNGREYGRQSTWSRTVNLEPVTQEIRDHIEKKRLEYILNNTNFNKVSLEKLQQIERILGA